MECKIDFNGEDWLRELDVYDRYFFEISFDHAELIYENFMNLVDKWKLKSTISDYEADKICYHNDGYSLAISGIEEYEVPCYYISLTFSKDMNTIELIEFLGDFMITFDHYDDIEINVGINGNTCNNHPKEIVKRMIENINNDKKYFEFED